MGKFAKASALISVATILFSPAPAALGEILGDILTSSKDSFAVQFEGQLGALWKNGSIPVAFHRVRNGGEKISQIWVDRYQLSYFPAWLDALTCDLNPDVCYRPLHLPKAPLERVGISSTYQLGTESGVWSELKAGYSLVLPEITVVRDTTSVTRPWPENKSIDDLKLANYVCQTNFIANLSCDDLFRYYNPKLGRLLDKQDTYEEPTYTYTFYIDSDCASLCAIIKPASELKISVGKYKSPWWEEPPYKLVTTGRSSDKSEVSGKAISELEAVDNAPTFDQRPTDVITKSARDATLDSKVNQAKGAFEKGGWNRINGIQHFSGPISPRQESWWKIARLPEGAKADDLMGQVTSNPSVMIIDSAFDEKHCEFAKAKFTVWDCKNAENDFQAPNACKVRSNDPVTAATSPDSAARGLCGNAGVVDEIPNPNTKPFRDRSHGTHLAGIVGARWDDKFGTGGINPDANIIGVEIDFNKAKNDRYGQWLAANLSQLMTRSNVRVANLSLGLDVSATSTTSDGTTRTNDWLTQLIKGKQKAALFVAAAGNERDPDDECLTMPACKVDTYTNIVSVVAMDVVGQHVMTNANFNRKFTIGTVGEQIFAPIPDNKFSAFSGSSQAAAVVSGAVSLAISLDANYTMAPYQIRQRLIACSNIAGSDMLDKMTGGDLDFECLANATLDLAYRVGAGSSASVLSGQLMPGTFHFTDITTNSTTELRSERVLGFQRLPGDPDDVVLFLARIGNDSKAQPERLRGTLLGSDFVRIQTRAGALERIKVEEIEKFVSRSVQGG
ncbi:subtilase family protein [Rhizobium sp. PP-CC-2G-626]|nr:subtilase family protein [Rhizobium sp. PP-CC-2G-626]